MAGPSAACVARAPAPRRCVVVGASARAFAESAARRGWQVHAADLFGDADLAATAAAVVRVGSAAGGGYPADLPGVVAAFPAGPCIYTGALENHPDVIDAIAAARPLAGCSAATLRRVRDPDALADVASACGAAFPETRTSPAGLPADGSFLIKPRRSAGGRGVRSWRGGRTPATGGHIWQRLVRGGHWSAAFVARAAAARLVGASRPLAGTAWCGGSGRAYCGSIDVPLPLLADPLRAAVERLGAALVAAFGLVGVFGIDVVVDATGVVHLLEVNPRPTASLELVERATGWSVAGGHLAGCGWDDEPPAGSGGDGIWAKAIAYAPRSCAASALAETISSLADRWTAHDGLRAVADLPADDAAITAGCPLVTVFARGATGEHARAALRRRVRRLRAAAAAGVGRRAAGAGVSRRAGAAGPARPRRGSTA